MRLPLATLLAALAVAALAPAAGAFNVVNNGLSAYRIDGVDNPTLNLQRGQTYTFNVAAIGHPFYIKTNVSTGTGSAYNTGVTNNGTQNGTITWTVAGNAPSTLFYNCSVHEGMSGQINVTGVVPGVTPATAGLLVVLLAGTGIVVVRRRRENRAAA